MPVDTAVTPVGSTAVPTVAGAAPNAAGAMPDFSMWSLFLHADIVVQSVMFGLILASFWGWAIIFDKLLTFSSIKKKTSKFENDFWAAEALDKFYDRVKKRATNNPMAQVFVAAMEEWGRSRIKELGSGIANKLGVKERIHQVMLVTRNREIERLESGLGFLATVGSTAPFVGLFGTVWGIMNSFQGIAMSKNTSLAVVAPGIAEALFATAIGLFAAIPAVIAYNKFSREVDKLDGKIEDFSVEFNTLMSRQIES